MSTQGQVTRGRVLKRKEPAGKRERERALLSAYCSASSLRHMSVNDAKARKETPEIFLFGVTQQFSRLQLHAD